MPGNIEKLPSVQPTEEPDFLVVSDLDEVIFNSIEEHQRQLTQLAEKKGEIEIPTLPEVLAVGGTHQAYQRFPWYQEANGAMRNSPEFNSGLPLMPGAREAIASFEAALHGYLTTRPETLTELSRKELIKNGFPAREVIARPKSVPLAETVAWKIGELEKIAQEKNKPVVMIDDSLKLFEAIFALSNPLISALLFRGPITPDHPAAKTWPEIMQTLQAHQ